MSSYTNMTHRLEGKKECASTLWSCDELSNFKLCIQTDRLLIVNLLYTNNLILYIGRFVMLFRIYTSLKCHEEKDIVRIAFNCRNRKQYWNVLDHNFIKIMHSRNRCEVYIRVIISNHIDENEFHYPLHLERLQVQCTVEHKEMR